jgi:hypothetical protein
MTVFWHVTSYYLALRYQRFVDTRCFICQGNSKFLRNVGKFPPDYTVYTPFDSNIQVHISCDLWHKIICNFNTGSTLCLTQIHDSCPHFSSILGLPIRSIFAQHWSRNVSFFSCYLSPASQSSVFVRELQCVKYIFPKTSSIHVRRCSVLLAWVRYRNSLTGFYAAPCWWWNQILRSIVSGEFAFEMNSNIQYMIVAGSICNHYACSKAMHICVKRCFHNAPFT